VREVHGAVDQPATCTHAQTADRMQVANELLRVTLGCGIRRRVHAKKQAWVAFDPHAQRSVTAAPVEVQSADLALGHGRLAAEVEVLHDALAGLAFVARHRHQVLHRRLGRDETVTHRRLSYLGHQVHKGQTSTDPAARATQSLAELFLAQSMSDDEVVQKPSILECATAADLLEPMRHDERVGFGERQQHGFDHVACERTRRAHTQVAVDQHEAVPLALDRCNHGDRALLAVGGQARAHARRSPGVANAKRGVAKLELGQFDLHRRPS